MSRKNTLSVAPPYAVETTIKQLGAYLRVARLRRGLTIKAIAEKIGTGPRAVSDAEKGKISTGIGIYAAMLWAMGLLEQLHDVAHPTKDGEGQALALSKEGKRARKAGELDNDF